VYSIEGNDDFIYYLGSNAVTLFRYSISAGTWTTLTPTVARAAAPGAGMSGHWIWEATDTAWLDESNILNGRFIYSFRGAAGAIVDRYDIALNTWTNDLTYAPKTEVFGAGSKWIYKENFLFGQKDATGRWFRYNVVTGEQDGILGDATASRRSCGRRHRVRCAVQRRGHRDRVPVHAAQHVGADAPVHGDLIMNHDDIIRQARTWVARQSTLRAEAERLGDTDAIARADAEIAETEALIAQLEQL
jgi:hypothetical protein